MINVCTPSEAISEVKMKTSSVYSNQKIKKDERYTSAKMPIIHSSYETHEFYNL